MISSFGTHYNHQDCHLSHENRKSLDSIDVSSDGNDCALNAFLPSRDANININRNANANGINNESKNTQQREIFHVNLNDSKRSAQLSSNANILKKKFGSYFALTDEMTSKYISRRKIGLY